MQAKCIIFIDYECVIKEHLFSTYSIQKPFMFKIQCIDILKIAINFEVKYLILLNSGEEFLYQMFY